jgi:hypothetical protein
MTTTSASPECAPPLPATRRPGYRGGVHTRIVDRGELLALARAHRDLDGAPATPAITDPPIGTRVAFPPTPRARCWRAGIVETTGRAGTRVAYVADPDRDHPDVHRARPHVFRELP